MSWLSDNKEFICDLAGNFFGLIAAVVAVFGDTWNSDTRRITLMGYLAILLALLGFGTTTLSSSWAAADAKTEELASEKAKHEENLFRNNLFTDLQAANSQIANSNHQIETLVATVKQLAEELNKKNNKNEKSFSDILKSTDSLKARNDSSSRFIRMRLDSSMNKLKSKNMILADPGIMRDDRVDR